MKGHKERLMLYAIDHVKNVDDQSFGEAYLLLMIIGTKSFSYATRWPYSSRHTLRSPNTGIE